MSAPKFYIEFGESAVDTKIVVGGVDITKSLSEVTIHCKAGELTRLDLKAAHGRASGTVAGIIANVSVDGKPVIKDGEVVK